MKKLIVATVALLTFGTTTILANGKDNETKTEKVFARQFAGAENVKWSDLDGGYKRVLFTLNGIGVEAYYDQDATFLGTVRNLFFNQLPLAAMQTVNKKFSDAVVIEVKEITNAEGTSFNVLLEQKDKTYNLKLNSLGYILEKEKIKDRK